MEFDHKANDIQPVLSSDDVPLEAARALYILWDDKRGQRLMPARRDFDPANMRALLEDMVLFDVDGAESRLRVRLYGTRIVQMSGLDLTGKYLDQIPGSENVGRRCQWVIAHKAPTFIRKVQLEWSQRSYRRYDVLALPLSANDKDVNMILFHLTFE
ncbi:hypothetical protein JCM17844_09910 [Iodidimonas gelatinilytica]|uniref:PAS domain-containing protein n=1 Tax=Iodidimonas gelatinilytica TaxID=1236966 RepID=A0A5A7MXH0_9PROT|nr:PAS domain-containing protein [Iodidimonas gelatinilytica]GEQ97354.1 hypothetical protein JCM17844_09910 [Iodidimonas gelatinilytica]GEQ99678.1 hypothetical protein JCM17845_03020 [Iodidimonas gelatinilytica]